MQLSYLDSGYMRSGDYRIKGITKKETHLELKLFQLKAGRKVSVCEACSAGVSKMGEKIICKLDY